MQPMPVVHLFEVAIEAGATKAFVQDREGTDDTREQLFNGESREVWRKKGTEGCRRRRISSVEADTNDRDEFGIGVVRVYEDPTKLDIGFLGRGLAGVKSIYIVD